MCTDLPYTSSPLPAFLSSPHHSTNLLSTSPLTIETSASSPPDEENKSYHDLTLNIHSESLNTQLISGESEPPMPFVESHLLEFGVQPENLENAPVENDSSDFMYDLASITNIFDDVNGFGCSFPDFGSGSDFGPESANQVLESGHSPTTFMSIGELPEINEDNYPCFNAYQSRDASVQPTTYPLKSGGCPIVNSTYMQENFDIARSLFSEADSCYEVDDIDTATLEVEQSQLGIRISPCQTEYSGVSPPTFQDEMSIIEYLSISKHSSLSSKISFFLSRMSLTTPPTLLDAGQTPMSIHGSTIPPIKVEPPIILPGVFSEYCWQHINRNKLRRCGHLGGLQKCNSKRLSETTETHRSLRADILSRIVQRTIRAADIHEIDTFGNSTMHISATMSAPPSYLISLIKLGGNVNALHNAKKSFLHLVKLEAVDNCDDFCYLLEILSVEGFNFSQHDHLGQSPLHMLTRPWNHPDLLRKVVMKLGSLPIHSHISTARDCLGYTVIEQINLQGTESSEQDLDQAILSLACETENPIVNPQDLHLRKSKTRHQNSSSKDEQTTRNYENHPSINTVEDLIQYEQHIDYWRIIITAIDSPWFEDSNGRNGLQCLAAACLVSPDMPLPDQLLARFSSLKAAGRNEKHSDREFFVKHLLKVGIDPNNYDNEGSTPVMAFIAHSRAAEGDDSTLLILNYLLEAGSAIHRRNRRGETALHLAVKLGRRAATKALLVSGANIHARTSGGLGVLELGHKHAMKSCPEGTLYSQIMLCISLVASFGAVSQPTILDEWRSPHWRLARPGCSEPKSFKSIKKFIRNKTNRR
jgi:ankyrin repeat protein